MPLPKPWPVFFGGIMGVIVVAFVIPQAFGMHDFTQWGGLFVDRPCVVHLADTHPRDGSPLRTGTALRSDADVGVWWHVPKHTARTCLSRAVSMCGEHAPGEGWIVRSAAAFWNDQPVTTTDACDLSPMPPVFTR